MEREIVLLTKSKMWHNYCAAGIDLRTKQWVRLCSGDRGIQNAVPLRDMVYSDGSFAQPLDKVRVKILQHMPSHFQPENYAYDPQSKWQRIGTATVSDVWDLAEEIACSDKYVFFDQGYKLRALDIEKIPQKQRYSLRLLKLDVLHLEVKRWRPVEDIAYRASFSWGREEYRYFRVTDQEFVAKYVQEGQYRVADVVCVVSLAHEHQGEHYKLMAAIFPV